MPGPVEWKQNTPTETSDKTTFYAAYPYIDKSIDEINFLSDCKDAAIWNPFGLVNGLDSDCTLILGKRWDPKYLDSLDQQARIRAVKPKTLFAPKKGEYLASDTLSVLRGGNFNDSLGLFYQTRGRYPLYSDLSQKGFRCVFSVAENNFYAPGIYKDVFNKISVKNNAVGSLE